MRKDEDGTEAGLSGGSPDKLTKKFWRRKSFIVLLNFVQKISILCSYHSEVEPVRYK